MGIIVTSDTHFTDRPRDEHRWGLFPWLLRMVRKHRASTVVFCGDLTDAKDRHPSTLVNRLVGHVDELSREAEVVVIRGNHDCVDEQHPFFGFLHRLKVIYVNRPTEFGIERKVCVFLPHTRNYLEDWGSLAHLGTALGGDVAHSDYIFCHQTFDGSVAENGVELEGIPPSFFADCSGKVISGDIHVPQDVSKRIVHVGSPYRVHFGDTFTPRVLLLEADRRTDLHFPCISREVVVVRQAADLSEARFAEGTQLKVRVRLKRQEFPDWPTIRGQVQEAVASRKWELCGLELVELQVRPSARSAEEREEASTPEDVLRAWASDRKLDKGMVKAGLEFLRGT